MAYIARKLICDNKGRKSIAVFIVKPFPVDFKAQKISINMNAALPFSVFVYRCVDTRRSMAVETLRQASTPHHVTVGLGRTAASAVTVLTFALSK